MTRTERLKRLLAGLESDVADYQRLEQLLAAQFAAAMGHRALELGANVAQILELTKLLESRRRERVALADGLLAGKALKASMAAVSLQLPLASRAAFDARCATVEALVKECKRLNMRNCHLITSQQDIMRRVLNAEPHTYASP